MWVFEGELLILQHLIEIDRHFINLPEGEMCVFSSQHTYKDLQKHRVKVTNHSNNNKSAQIQQNTKCVLAGVIKLLHGCSTTSTPADDPTFSMVEALSNEPIFNTMVQRGSKPREAWFEHHCWTRKFNASDLMWFRSSCLWLYTCPVGGIVRI